MTPRTQSQLSALIDQLRAEPAEPGWLEFRCNAQQPEAIGKYISALSNAAALMERQAAYVVWGIEDVSHAIVGTTFDPVKARKGNEPLETWLANLLTPRIAFQFASAEMDGKRVVVLEVAPAAAHPVRFSGTDYIRIGSSTQPLANHPEIERKLWATLAHRRFEEGDAEVGLSIAGALERLDWAAYCRLLEIPAPQSGDTMVDRLAADGLVRQTDEGTISILNLGALLLAHDLRQFASLGRKTVRIVVYRGVSRIEAEREIDEVTGYAAGFQALTATIDNLLPRSEEIADALRLTVPVYPMLAIRELLANALIHQDLTATGAGPMIEIFDDRMEISNPGEPLVPPDRFLDSAPQSRNEAMASLMRRMRICEERGSGIDKVIFQTELHQLPAPEFISSPGSTRAILFGKRTFVEMDPAARVRACYFHACLQWASNGTLTNASIRRRFGIDEKNSATASRLIREAVLAGMIKAENPTSAKKLMRYVPYWA